MRLKEHQRAGIAWLWMHYRSGRGGVLLADDMGLGKTLQIACFLALQARCGVEADRELPSLVTTPLILLENWKTELSRYFKPGAVPKGIPVTSDLMRAGGDSLLGALHGPSVVLMPYDTLARHQKALLRIPWATAVLDESQNVKNPGTYRSAAVRGLKRSFGICSTGTPVENRLRDLWAQFDFLSPGRPFEDAGHFLQKYEQSTDGPKLLRKALDYPSTSSPVLRREKKATLKDLPPLVTKEHLIPMTPGQESLEQQIVSTRSSALGILGDLQRLYQHPALLREGTSFHLSDQEAIAESPKLAKCLELLDQIHQREERVLIFTLWSGMQDLLRDVVRRRFALPSVHIINGESNQAKKSQAHITEFSNAPGFGVLIMSPLAAGAGLNVTAANHVIHYGRWWNPAKEDQATGRAHRIGQQHPVYEHYLVLHHPDDPKNGFDVKLHELVVAKRRVARDFLAPLDIDRDVEAALHATIKEP
jgi:SNF2 family DNA or RNA helicase